MFLIHNTFLQHNHLYLYLSSQIPCDFLGFDIGLLNHYRVAALDSSNKEWFWKDIDLGFGDFTVQFKSFYFWKTREDLHKE